MLHSYTRIIDKGGTKGFVNCPVDFYPSLQEYQKHKTDNLRVVFPARKTFHVMNAARDDLRAADQPPFAVFCGMPSIPARKHTYTVL